MWTTFFMGTSFKWHSRESSHEGLYATVRSAELALSSYTMDFLIAPITTARPLDLMDDTPPATRRPNGDLLGKRTLDSCNAFLGPGQRTRIDPLSA
jgi:hypothetical protein